MFERTQDDEKSALSLVDEIFLAVMDKKVFIDYMNRWVAPLPSHSSQHHLPKNREQATKYLSSLWRTLKRRYERTLSQFHAEDF